MPEGVKAYLRPLARKRCFPTSSIIGAQKAGTTWLHRNLQAHPQVWMPKEKELHYFDEKLGAKTSLWSKLWGTAGHGRALAPAGQAARLGRYSEILRAGHRLGPEVLPRIPERRAGTPPSSTQGRGKIVGETTPDYSVLGRKRTIAHVHEIMPEAKIIFMMRNPIERAWSQSRMERRSGRNLEDVTGRGVLPPVRTTAVAADDGLPEDARELERLLSGGADLRRAFWRTSTSTPKRSAQQPLQVLGRRPFRRLPVIKTQDPLRDVEHDADPVAVHLADAYLGRDQASERALRWLRLVLAPLRPEARRGPARQGRGSPYPFWESPLWEEWKGIGLGHRFPGGRCRVGHSPPVWAGRREQAAP